MRGKESWLMGLANIHDYQMVIGCQRKHLSQLLLTKKQNQSLAMRGTAATKRAQAASVPWLRFPA